MMKHLLCVALLACVLGSASADITSFKSTLTGCIQNGNTVAVTCTLSGGSPAIDVSTGHTLVLKNEDGAVTAVGSTTDEATKTSITRVITYDKAKSYTCQVDKSGSESMISAPLTRDITSKCFIRTHEGTPTACKQYGTKVAITCTLGGGAGDIDVSTGHTLVLEEKPGGGGAFTPVDPVAKTPDEATKTSITRVIESYVDTNNYKCYVKNSKDDVKTSKFATATTLGDIPHCVEDATSTITACQQSDDKVAVTCRISGGKGDIDVSKEHTLVLQVEDVNAQTSTPGAHADHTTDETTKTSITRVIDSYDNKKKYKCHIENTAAPTKKSQDSDLLTGDVKSKCFIREYTGTPTAACKQFDKKFAITCTLAGGTGDIDVSTGHELVLQLVAGKVVTTVAAVTNTPDEATKTSITRVIDSYVDTNNYQCYVKNSKDDVQNSKAVKAKALGTAKPCIESKASTLTVCKTPENKFAFTCSVAGSSVDVSRRHEMVLMKGAATISPDKHSITQVMDEYEEGETYSCTVATSITNTIVKSTPSTETKACTKPKETPGKTTTPKTTTQKSGAPGIMYSCGLLLVCLAATVLKST